MQELIHNFGIDPKLLLAQAINFFILLVILKKFAYKPILKALQERKEEIKKGIDYTAKAEEKLASIEGLKEKTLADARKESLSLMINAEKKGEERKQEIIKEAEKKVESIVQNAKKTIAEQKLQMSKDIRKEAETMVRMGLEKTLGKMPASERDKKLIQEAMKELKTAI